MWLFAVLVVAIIGAIAVVATGAGDPLSPSYDDRPDVTVPADRPLRAEDLRTVRFTSVVRGYRASEVDALLDRLAREMDDPQIPTRGLRETPSDEEALPESKEE
ncbi:MAG: DivIVA domain-containing protein [Marmoricola sp.]